MNRLTRAILVLAMAGFLSSVFAEQSKSTNIPTDKPIVTTWSKIKELFQ